MTADGEFLGIPRALPEADMCSAVGASGTGGLRVVRCLRVVWVVWGRRGWAPGLAEEFGDDAAFFDSGEALVEALELEGEAAVVDSHQVQNRGVEFV